MSWNERTLLLIGGENAEKLERARVALFGIGGVGSYAAEALTRAGIGHLTFVDGDTVEESNINRQIVALHSTLGRNKAEVMAERARDINPDADVTAIPAYITDENIDCFDFTAFDYVADAIDTVTSKLLIIEACRKRGTAVISSMGTGSKMDPAGFEVTDIFRTSVDPLSRVMRKELRRRGITELDVVFSREEPVTPNGGGPVGSIAFVPSVAGLTMAGHIVRRIIGT